jgi:hypothetical protein
MRQEASMPKYVHSVEELRNRFSYDPETGVIRWRDVPFIYWARGRPQSKQGHYLKWRREKAGKVAKFFKNNIWFRGITYTAPRLAWVLHYGSHPGEKYRIVPKDKNPENLRINNLEKVTEQEFGARVRMALIESKGKKYRDVPRSVQSVKILRAWFYYDTSTGNLHWNDISWKEWKRYNKKTTADAHDLWLHENAYKVVEFFPGRNGDQVMKFKKVYYERKVLTFAVVRGYHITNAVYLYHKDGDETNFRIENLAMSIRGDWVDPDDEDEWPDDDEEVEE